jgi:hypothetical protein
MVPLIVKPYRSTSLTFSESRLNIKIVRRIPNNLVASGLVIFFALGVWCASLSAPAQALASQMPDCSTPGSVGQPCQPLLCNLAASHNLLSQGALSTKSYDSARDRLFLIGNILPVLSSNDSSLAANQLPAIWTGYRPEKVSVHLFNSVLTL